MNFNEIFSSTGEKEAIQNAPTPQAGQDAILVSMTGLQSVFVEVPQDCNIKSAVIGAASAMGKVAVSYSIMGVLV